MYIFVQITLEAGSKYSFYIQLPQSVIISVVSHAELMRHTINNQKRAGIAWIFSNENGSHLSHGSATLESITSPLVAEAIALRSGLLSAVELEHQKLKAFSDNLTLIRAINNDLQVEEIFGIVKDIQRISSAFVEISFSHLSRSLNVEADRLAKLSLFLSRVSDPSMG